MKTTILNAIIEHLDLKKENVKLLIDSLEDCQKESALEILLGAHPYQDINTIRKTKVVENTETREFIGPLKLTGVSLINNEIKYREDFYIIPVRYYKDASAFGTSDYKTYICDEYTEKYIAVEDKKMDYNNKIMSIEKWMEK